MRPKCIKQSASSKRDIMVSSKINSERGKMRERMDDKNLEDLWKKRNQVDMCPWTPKSQHPYIVEANIMALRIYE